mgnify:CR=1 FL=1
MSRYTGPSWKLSRRLKYSISGTGKEIAKRPYAPGMHGQKRSKLSEYGVQLQEKQKVRFTYGVNEKQFRKTFDEASKLPGKAGENFLKVLETRLDNVVYRIGFASTRAQARQLVNHGHILVDGKKVDIASYRVTPGQVVSLKEKDKDMVVVKEALEKVVSRVEFVTFDTNKLTGTFVRYPERSELNADINESLIVEFYNR